MNGVGVGGQQLLRGDGALGHPGAFVQQAARSRRAARYRLRRSRSRALPAARARRCNRPHIPCRRRTTAGPAIGTPSFRCPRHRAGLAERTIARIAVGAVGPAHHLSAAQASSTVSAKTEMQSSVRQAGTSAVRRDQPEAGLQADDIVEAGRHAAGTGGVGAERQRHQSCRDRDRRTGARTAGNQFVIERVARHAIRRTHADQPGGELIEIGLADDDGAGGAQARHRWWRPAPGYS